MQMPQSLSNDWLSMQLSHQPPLQGLHAPAYFTIATSTFCGLFVCFFFRLIKNNSWPEQKALLPEQIFGFLYSKLP